MNRTGASCSPTTRSPGFDATKALEITRDRDADIPFVVVSGTLGEERAFQLVKAGANAYVPKDRLERLPDVVSAELGQADARLLKRMDDQNRLRTHRLQSLGTIAGGIAHEFNSLALLDRAMPRKTGDEVLKRVRELRPGLPVIMASGYAVEKLTYRNDTGPLLLVSKPFTVSDLLAHVEASIGKAQKI